MKNNKSQSGFSAVELLIVIIVIVILAAVGYVLYKDRHKSVTTSTSSTKVVVADPNTAQIFSGIKQKLATAYTLQDSTDDPPDSNTISLSTGPGGPAMTVSGYNYYVSPVQGSYLSVMAYEPPSETTSLPDVTKIINLITTEFSTLKLVSIPGNPILPYANYQNGSTYCYFDSTTSGQDQNYPFEVICADKSTYVPAAIMIKPLADAYYAANSVPTGSKIIFSGLSIKNSVTPGYKYAKMGIGEGQGYFYQVGGKWYLYTAGEEGLNCNFTTNSQASLNNNDARLALLGLTCINDDLSQGVVK